MSTDGGSAVKGRSRPTRRNSSGNRSDIGWQYGTDVDGDGKRVQCNYCQKIVNGVYRFKHHLARTKQDVEACLSVTDDVRVEIVSVLDEGIKKRKRMFNTQPETEQGSANESSIGISKSDQGTRSQPLATSSQSTLNQIFKKDLREQACREIARWWYANALPFNAVRCPRFQKIWDTVARYGIGFKPPSYHEIRVALLEKEKKEIEGKLDDFKKEWKKTGVSLMSDGWSDKKRRSTMNLLANSPSGTVFLNSFDISENAHTAEYLYELLNLGLSYVGEENVVQVVTDNAANYKAAGALLMAERKGMYWTPCAAHCIDLMLEDLAKKIRVHKLTIAKGKRITRFIYKKVRVLAILRHFTKGKDLIRPAVTRFATSYLTLGSLQDKRAALRSMLDFNMWKCTTFAKTSEGRLIQKVVLNSRFWSDLNACLKAVNPLIQVLRLVDSDQPAMGFIYHAMDQAKGQIQENFNNVTRNYEPILKIINDRWEMQLHRPLHSAGYYLNPCFHYDDNFKGNTLSVKKGLYDCIDRLIPDVQVQEKVHLQLDVFTSAEGMLGSSAAKMTRKKKAPWQWWSSFGDECPELQQFAIKVLSLTCSSSGCERNWSEFDRVHTKKRNNLFQEKLNDLVYVMHNMRLQDKRSGPSLNPDVAFEDLPSDDEWITGGPFSREDARADIDDFMRTNQSEGEVEGCDSHPTEENFGGDGGDDEFEDLDDELEDEIFACSSSDGDGDMGLD